MLTIVVKSPGDWAITFAGETVDVLRHQLLTQLTPRDAFYHHPDRAWVFHPFWVGGG